MLIWEKAHRLKRGEIKSEGAPLRQIVRLNGRTGTVEVSSDRKFKNKGASSFITLLQKEIDIETKHLQSQAGTADAVSEAMNAFLARFGDCQLWFNQPSMKDFVPVSWLAMVPENEGQRQTRERRREKRKNAIPALIDIHKEIEQFEQGTQFASDPQYHSALHQAQLEAQKRTLESLLTQRKAALAEIQLVGMSRTVAMSRKRPENSPELSNYLIGKCIGQGNQSEVFEGWDMANARKVAIKRVPFEAEKLGTIHRSVPEIKSEVEVLHILREELGLAEKVVTVYDSFVGQDKAFYIVMEYLESACNPVDALKTVERNEKLPRLKKYMMDSLDALATMAPVMQFEDISEDNWLMEPRSGDLKIIDPGISSLTYYADDASKLNLGRPDHLHGQINEPTFFQHPLSGFRKDLFALSATFYRLIAGENLVNLPDDANISAIDYLYTAQMDFRLWLDKRTKLMRGLEILGVKNENRNQIAIAFARAFEIRQVVEDPEHKWFRSVAEFKEILERAL